MGFRESWYRPGQPLLTLARLVAYALVGGYLLFVSALLPPAGAWLPLYRAAGWILTFTALGVYVRRVPPREELDFLALLPVSRLTQLAMWLAEGLVRHLGFALAVLCLFAGPAMAFPASLGALAVTYPLLWLHTHLAAVALKLMLDHLERVRWLYLLALLPLAGLAVGLGRALGTGTGLPDALTRLAPLDRWVGIYWYAAAVTAGSWTEAVLSLLVGLAGLAGLAAVAVALLATLPEAPAPAGGARWPAIRGHADPVRAAGSPAARTAPPPHPLVTLLRHDLRRLLRRPRHAAVTWVAPLGVVALVALAGGGLLELAREGDAVVRGILTVLLPTLLGLTAGPSVAWLFLQEDHGILGLLRSTAGSLTYLLSKWLYLSALSAGPVLAGSGLVACLIRADWRLTVAIAAASVVVAPALTLLLHVLRTAMGANPREPSTSSFIWFGLGAYVYAITLLAFVLTGLEALILPVAIPAWLLLVGLGIVLASRLLERMDLAE
nr:MAG: hypothetical protein DIU55_10780 [Bacillota bacterium]